MNMIKIAAAQIAPIAGEIEQNIQKHCALIRQAAEQGADLVFFSELSLTGYEPPLAKVLAMKTDDPRLEVFQRLSNQYDMVIGVGFPSRCPEGIRISMLFFQAGQAPLLYSKQHLHADELPFFVPGNEQIFLKVKGFTIAPAICYESLLHDHAESVVKKGAQIYLASVAKSAQGLAKAYLHYPVLSKQFGLKVVMANCVGPSDDFVSAGGSGFWGPGGFTIGEESDVLMMAQFGESVYTLKNSEKFL
jgi:predicted amidohydrolase